jgi:hypothetical protein
MSAASKQTIGRRSVGAKIWLSHDAADNEFLSKLPVNDIRFEVQQSEEAVGRAMFDEIVSAAAAKNGPLVIVISTSSKPAARRLQKLTKPSVGL